ncbi:MAG: 3-hydroxyacyl-ACP dehydratase FabZ [Holophagales bacterium]|jgi:beta-hydroxyacyl-ACP dehydratase FabZ|nr:3-hydroxyacyl-ACP dehydratase FabZ [Holophagales bacterium]
MSEIPDASSKTIDIQGIQKLLPHRYPILLVDRILDFERGSWIEGIKNISMGEQVFQGHFPRQPVFPGVLIVEAMAQTAGCLVTLDIPNPEEKIMYFMSIDNVKFRKPVVPGDQLVMKVKINAFKRNIAKMRGEAFVDGVKVAEAEFMSMVVDVERAR